jgi:pimeloyl-ACP methyl ester carboxylesterase
MTFLVRWVGGSYEWSPEEYDVFLDRFRQSDRAEAGSQYYRTFQLNEMIPWMKGQYKKPVDIPLRWVTGLDDPVVTPTLLRSHVDLSADIDFEEIPGIGHYLLEQAPELGLERLQDLMRL